jgi:hypothetical protein
MGTLYCSFRFIPGLNISNQKIGRKMSLKETQVSVLSSAVASLHAGDVFHGLNKEDHRHSAPAAPRNSPTGLAPLPALSPVALSPASTPHLANLAAPSFPKTATTAPGFVDSRKSFCPAPVAPPPSTTDGSVSAPPSVCR